MSVRPIAEAELSEGESFHMDVDSERLGCAGRMSCTFTDRRIELRRTTADTKPVSLDLGLVRVMLTFKKQRAFMLQLDGNLSHFVVEDPTLYDHIVARVRYGIADALLDSPAASPAARESRVSRASSALRTVRLGLVDLKRSTIYHHRESHCGNRC